MGWCTDCGSNKKLSFSPQELRRDQHALKVAYHYYDYVDEPTSYLNNDGSPKTTRKLKLLKHAEVPVGEFLELYCQKLQFSVYHRNFIRHMTRARLERAGFWAGDISLIMDYSEN